MRDAKTYRTARRNAARKAKYLWRDLPFAELKLRRSSAKIVVRAVPTLDQATAK